MLKCVVIDSFLFQIKTVTILYIYFHTYTKNSVQVTPVYKMPSTLGGLMLGKTLFYSRLVYLTPPVSIHLEF